LRRPRSELRLLRTCAALAGLALVATVPAARATPPPAETPEVTASARREFVAGTDFVHKAQWAEALAAFERSAKLRPHAVTTYNIGACQRALGRYALARKTLRQALVQNEAAGNSLLPEGLVAEIVAYVHQINDLLASAEVTLDPPGAAIAVDGRPLEAGERGEATPPVLVAGVRDPGAGETPPVAAFKLVLDPGVHVITISRKGYADAVVNRTFAPSSTITLPLVLDRLPATLHITSNRPDAVVTVNGADVGTAPVDVSRPGGSYRVVVARTGFLTYETQVNVQPGQEVDLRASLPEETHPITKQWWFWTASLVVVAGAVTATYFATRSTPEAATPPLQCGGLGWCVKTQ
jgi:hypothetical protein